MTKFEILMLAFVEGHANSNKKTNSLAFKTIEGDRFRDFFKILEHFEFVFQDQY